MFCTISYHLYNLKNVKNTRGGMSLLGKFQPYITKSVTPVDGCFESFNQYLEQFCLSLVFYMRSRFILKKMYHCSMWRCYIQFTMGIYTINVSIKPTFTFAIMKKNCIFFLGFILQFNIAKVYLYIMQSFQFQTFLFLILSFLFNPSMSFSRTTRTSRAKKFLIHG